MRKRDWPTDILTLIILLLALSPLWLWGLDNIFHFGYCGD